MSARQLLGIFGVLVALVGAWLLARGADDASDRAGGDGGLDLAALVGPAGDLSAIRMDRPDGDTLRIERQGDGWLANGYPADDSLVVATLRALTTLPPLRLIARNAASHGRMGLLADSAVRVRFNGPSVGLDSVVLVGGSGRQGRFVRLADADRVYVGPSDVLDPLVGTDADWRDFRIARVDTATLARVVVRRGGRVATVAERAVAVEAPVAEGAPRIVRAGPWTVAGETADTAVMRLYVGALGDLEATGFPADSFAAAADFEQPAATVELYGAENENDGRTAAGGGEPDLTLLFSTGLDHPDVLVRRSDSPIVYAIDRARANLLTTTPGRLLGRI